MSLRFLLDEHLRGGGLWQAIRQHNSQGIEPLDAVRVGDPADLPLGTPDPLLLLWAEREGRVLVTRDQQTMPGHLAAHLASGHHLPGILLIRKHTTLAQIVFHLALHAYAADPALLQDSIVYIPY